MAIREVRLNFMCEDIDQARELNGSVGQPFAWFMDGVMRGRFKMYSGPEVKGVNTVNCNLMSSNYECSNKWETIANTHNIERHLELRLFQGNRIEQVTQGILYFSEIAKESPLPQVQLIKEQALESISNQKVEMAIEKADEYFAYIYEHRMSRT